MAILAVVIIAVIFVAALYLSTGPHTAVSPVFNPTGSINLTTPKALGSIANSTPTMAKTLSGIASFFNHFFNGAKTALFKAPGTSKLTVYLTSGNQYLLDRAAFARMRKGVLILNVARGKLIEEAALIEALESGRVAGAGLDVFEEEPPRNPKLYQHPKVVGVPHIGASTREAQEKAGRTVAEDVLRVLQGETPEFPVHV